MPAKIGNGNMLMDFLGGLSEDKDIIDFDYMKLDFNDDLVATKEVYNNLTDDIPKELRELKELEKLEKREKQEGRSKLDDN